MRLRRIEVDRYGALHGVALGGFGDGLTVVFGPNEAGKSTYTALVRHVLYGYPTPSSKRDTPYLSDAGKRAARLVFDDGEGEWSIERTEGPHGGPVVVRGPDGSRRDALVGDLTRGVSDTAFRVVFGFGLDEMAQIEQMRGSEDDIIGRLYAASVGLAVSPMDVRSAIEAEVKELFAPRASKPRVNALSSDLRRVREELREAERVSEEYREDRHRLAALEEQLEGAALARASAQERLASFRVAMERVEASDRVIDEGEEELKELRLRLRDVQADAAAPVDEAALAAGPVVDGALEDLSAFKQQLEDRSRQGSLAAQASAEIGLIATEAEIDAEALLGIRVDSHRRSEIDIREDGLRRAEAQRAAAGEQAAGSAAADGVSAAGGAAGPGVGLLVIAAVAVGAGFVLGDVARWLGVGIGLVVGAVGVWMLYRSRGRSGVGDDGERSRADAAALARADQAHAAAAAAWEEGLADLRLPAGSPTRIRSLLDAAERARAAQERRRDAEAELARLDAALETYRERLAEAGAPLAGAVPGSVDDVVAYAATVRAALVGVREAAACRDRAIAEADSLGRRMQGISEAVAEARDEAMGTYRDLGLDSGGSTEVLRRAAEEAGAVAVEAERAYDESAEERSRLAERLDVAARASLAAELRLQEATLEEEMAQAVERYTVLAVASELLARAQERYERERQPDVVQAAQGFLASITEGRYVGVRIPLGEDTIEVVDESGRARRSSDLSRGTVEQMYLALRLGLISRMGEAGADLPLLMDDVFVNFDPERARGAAQAVAELALTRQVVLFTCHPATLALLEDVATPTVIRLERCW